MSKQVEANGIKVSQDDVEFCKLWRECVINERGLDPVWSKYKDTYEGKDPTKPEGKAAIRMALRNRAKKWAKVGVDNMTNLTMSNRGGVDETMGSAMMAILNGSEVKGD